MARYEAHQVTCAKNLQHPKDLLFESRTTPFVMRGRYLNQFLQSNRKCHPLMVRMEKEWEKTLHPNCQRCTSRSSTKAIGLPLVFCAAVTQDASRNILIVTCFFGGSDRDGMVMPAIAMVIVTPSTIVCSTSVRQISKPLRLGWSCQRYLKRTGSAVYVHPQIDLEWLRAFADDCPTSFS